MHRIDTPTAQRDKFGERKNGFTRGNPQTGTPATQLDYLYCDAIQEEIANAIELAGIKLDKSKHNQLATAIKELVSKGSVKLNSSTNSTSETEAATPLAVKKVNDNAVSAHNRISQVHDYAISVNNSVNYVNDRVNVITDKFQTDNYESRVYSADKRVYMVIRNDGVMGMYSHVKNEFVWHINHDGWMYGYITADRIGGLDQFVRDRTPPVGVPMPWPQHYPPAGYFECNGSTFDKNQCPKLAAAYPAGVLPDLRGEFIRGWDNARGADPYRSILEWQGDAVRNIYGRFPVVSRAGRAEPIESEGAFHSDSNWNAAVKIGDSDNWGRVYSFDASRVVPVAHENRPRNIAFMYIVKAE